MPKGTDRSTGGKRPTDPKHGDVVAHAEEGVQSSNLPVPPDTDDIGEILRHAYEYNGYERHRGFDAVARIAGRSSEQRCKTGRWDGTLDELRCTLFFKQRAAHHQGEAPTGEELKLVRELYQVIRSRWEEACT